MKLKKDWFNYKTSLFYLEKFYINGIILSSKLRDIQCKKTYLNHPEKSDKKIL